MKKVVPTIKQRLAMNGLLEAKANGETISMKKIMKEAGFSDASAINPGLNLTSRPGWKQLMDENFNDEAIVKEINSIAFGDNDKRAKLAAIDMMLKLKEKYPANKFKVDGMDNEYKSLFVIGNATERERTPEEN